MSPKHPKQLRDFATKSLESHIIHEELDLSPLMHMVLHFCGSSTDDNAGPAFGLLGKHIHQWTRSEMAFLRVAQEAYKSTPCAVISSIEHWAGLFMASKIAAVREATEIWLRGFLFEPDSISDSPRLDVIRFRQTRKLVQSLTPRLTAACEGGHARTKYECAINALVDAEKYLKAVQTEGKVRSRSTDEGIRASITEPLRTELDEMPLLLTELKAFEDVEQDWEADEPLPASRRSLEPESEEETTESEMYEDGDESPSVR